MTKIKKAIEFAASAHKNQRRKNLDVGYFIHPYDVFKILSLVTQDENILCAGLLHDVIEDTGHDYDEIKEEFGAEIADIVLEVTKRKGKITTKEGLLVKLADMLSNISDSSDLAYIKKKINMIRSGYYDNNEMPKMWVRT